jgi:glycosyltransferase involved in cell wall biosynthesis
MNQPVSAVIIARNEDKHLPRCLASLAWADEILVVDAESTDKTAEICQSPTEPWSGKMRFIRRAWTGFRDQRNFAMKEARNDWIFVVDADEACSPELAARVQTILSDPGGPRAYKVKRIEYFLGKPISWGIWNPSYQDRFFHREGVSYVNEVHEYPVFPQPASRIHEPLHHAPDFDIQKFLGKMNHYTSIEARDRVAQGRRTNAFRMLFAFPAMFWKNYVYYKAYKDGMHGFVISILEGISRAVRHVKIWQYQSELKKDR